MSEMDNQKKPYWIGHRERLRRRVATGSHSVVRPYEIIESVLFYAVPRLDVSEVARNLIHELGSVGAVMDATYEQLMAVPGMTKRMADVLLITGELVRAYSDIRQEKQFRIFRYRDMMRFLEPRCRFAEGQLWALFTDYDERLVSFIKISDAPLICGTSQSRQVLEYALTMEARYVYIVGCYGIEPLELYPEETECVSALADALNVIGVRMMDYLLVGEAGIISLNKMGQLAPLRMRPGMERLRERYISDEEDFYEGNDRYGGNRKLYEGEPEPI